MMSEFSFKVDLQESLRRGVPCRTQQPITIQVNPAEIAEDDRKAIAERLTREGKLMTRRERDGYVPNGDGFMLVAPEPTVKGVIEQVNAEDAAVASYAGRVAEQHRVEEAERKAESLRLMETPQVRTRTMFVWVTDTGSVETTDRRPYGSEEGRVTICRDFQFQEKYQPYLPSEEVRKGKAAADQEAMFAALNKEARATAEITAVNAAMADDQERRGWIQMYGSERLKKLIREGLGNKATYLKERDKWEAEQIGAEIKERFPGWFVPGDEVEENPPDATSRAMALLDAARVQVPTAKLGRFEEGGKYVAYTWFESRIGRSVIICWPAD